MRTNLRAMSLLCGLVLGTSLALAGPAFAGCEGMREFTGLLQGMKKGEKGGFVVDNRQGDKVKFIRDATSTVVDESGGATPKTDWDKLANGDVWEQMGAVWSTLAKPSLGAERRKKLEDACKGQSFEVRRAASAALAVADRDGDLVELKWCELLNIDDWWPWAVPTSRPRIRRPRRGWRPSPTISGSRSGIQFGSRPRRSMPPVARSPMRRSTRSRRCRRGSETW